MGFIHKEWILGYLPCSFFLAEATRFSDIILPMKFKGLGREPRSRGKSAG